MSKLFARNNLFSMSAVEAIASSVRINKDKCIYLAVDARIALKCLPNDSVDCIITSPPYGNLKDYGSQDQIGFGQHSLDEYFADLQEIFAELYRIAKEGTALWLILDNWKTSGELVPLPWELMSRAQQSGWNIHDVIIWDKGRSLPWSHVGRFRSVCEHVILLGKGKLAKFDLDAARDIEDLSPYWVRYPERYHPDGKAPSDLWHFPIPNQGSWSHEQLRHFCPLPVGLVARMIAITTKPRATVLDPFAGTGTVVAVSSYLGRYGLGFDVNSEFVESFRKFGHTELVSRAQKELTLEKNGVPSLRKTIIQLRILKYPKMLFMEVARKDRLHTNAKKYISAFLLTAVSHSSSRVVRLRSRELGYMRLLILAHQGADLPKLEGAVMERVGAPPLSKFGLKVDVEVVPFDAWHDDVFLKNVETGQWNIYSGGRFFCSDGKVKYSNLMAKLHSESDDVDSKIPSIFSKLSLRISRPNDG
jgi:DNA modification methylase